MLFAVWQCGKDLDQGLKSPHPNTNCVIVMQSYYFFGLFSSLSSAFLNQHTLISTGCITESKNLGLTILFFLVTLSQLRSSFHQAVSTHHCHQ